MAVDGRRGVERCRYFFPSLLRVVAQKSNTRPKTVLADESDPPSRGVLRQMRDGQSALKASTLLQDRYLSGRGRPSLGAETASLTTAAFADDFHAVGVLPQPAGATKSALTIFFSATRDPRNPTSLLMRSRTLIMLPEALYKRALFLSGRVSTRSAARRDW